MKKKRKTIKPDNRQYQEYVKTCGGALCPICGCPTTSRSRGGDFQTEIESKTDTACIRQHKCAQCQETFLSKENIGKKPSWWVD